MSDKFKIPTQCEDCQHREFCVQNNCTKDKPCTERVDVSDYHCDACEIRY